MIVGSLAQVITLVGSTDLANNKASILENVNSRVANYGPIMVGCRLLLLLRLVVMMVMMIVLQAVTRNLSGSRDCGHFHFLDSLSHLAIARVKSRCTR